MSHRGDYRSSVPLSPILCAQEKFRGYEIHPQQVRPTIQVQNVGTSQSTLDCEIPLILSGIHFSPIHSNTVQPVNHTTGIHQNDKSLGIQPGGKRGEYPHVPG